MDPTKPEEDLPAALPLADVGDHVAHGADVFHVRRVHVDKKMQRDRLGHERTTLHYGIDAVVGDPAYSDDDTIIGDLL